MAIGTIAAIAGGIGALGAGIAGAVANMSAQERAALLQEKSVQEWLKLNIPNIEDQKLALEKFVLQGEFTPQLEQAVATADTEFKNISQDPRLKESRLRSLAALEELGTGGERLEDQAALQNMLLQTGSAARGRQGAITSEMERRGQLGSGLELAAQLSQAQNQQDQLASQGLNLEAQRRQRALEALSRGGDLAGSIQEQDYRVASDRAKAQDSINQFNTQLLAGSNQRNVDRGNQGSIYNLDRAQDISNKNTSLSNAEQEYNKKLIQQDFENRKARTAGITGQYGQQAGQEIQSGQNLGNMWGSVASGVGNLTSGVLGYLNEDKKKKPIE